MNRYAVLAPGFEHLSYPLGKRDASENKNFSERKQEFIVRRVESKTHAEMIVGSSDWLSNHAALPVGYVGDDKGEVFVVCSTSGKKYGPEDMSDQERRDYSCAVIARLAALHSEGFGCGGLSPEAIDYSRKQARLSDPSKIFALIDSDSLFFEAVATLRSLAGSGYAKKSELCYLASVYLSASPVCRQGVVSHLKRKGMRHTKPHLALSDVSARFVDYF